MMHILKSLRARIFRTPPERPTFAIQRTSIAFATLLLLTGNTPLSSQVIQQSPIISADSSNITLKLASVANRTYFIQYSPNTENWLTFNDFIQTGESSLVEYKLPIPLTKSLLRLIWTDIPSEDPLTADFDDDGLSTLHEIQTSNTNPLASDSDGDGFSDGEETTEGTDPNDIDNRPSFLKRISLKEPLGIDHEAQLVELDSSFFNPSDITEDYYIVDANDRYYPHQISRDGKLLLLFQNGMSADETITLYIKSGNQPEEFENTFTPISRREEATNHLLENSRIAIRIPKEVDNPTKFLAPLQSFRYRDGTWAMTGDNLAQVRYRGNYYAPSSIDKMTVTFVEEGPLRTIVQINYTIQEQSSPRYYNSTITLFAHDDTIMVEIDSDYDVKWEIPLTTGIVPDRGQYRTMGGTTHINHGYHPGTLGTISGDTEVDAFVNLPFASAMSYEGRRLMPNWNYWQQDSGYYWQFYDKDDSANANMLGMFGGPPSRIIGGHYSGLEPYSNGGNTYLKCMARRRGPDTTWSDRNRFGFGLFIGQKSDVAAFDAYQPIQKRMNIYSGLNLSKLLNYKLDYIDPEAGFQHMYLPKAGLERTMKAIQEDPLNEHKDGPYGIASRTSPSYRDLWNAINDSNDMPALITGLTNRLTRMAKDYYNEAGIYSKHTHYWKGALIMTRDALRINTLLALNDIQPGIITAEQKSFLKKLQAIYYYWIHDDDFFPLQPNTTTPRGTSNMPIQYQSSRDTFGLLAIGAMPQFSQNVDPIITRTQASIDAMLNTYGSHESSPHYISASMAPTLNTLLQLKASGADGGTIDPKLESFAQFQIDLLTPPEVRFGTARKIPGIGDGATESASLTGVLASLFQGRNNTLAGKLIKAWRDGGSIHSEFNGTTSLSIDETIPSAPYTIGDKNLEDYLVTLRNQTGGDNESALYFINGEHYRDHRHMDAGNYIIYANGGPLSLDWGSQYQPRITTRAFHNSIIAEKSLFNSQEGAPFNWTSSNYKINTTYGGANNGEDRTIASNHSFSKSVSWAESTFELIDHRLTSPDTNYWTRKVISHKQIESDSTIFRIRDTFTGDWTGDSKIATINLMAKGNVSSPNGILTPTLATQTAATPLSNYAPSSATAHSHSPGIHKLEFTGQWKIDFTVFIIARDPFEYAISHYAHYWNNSLEQAQFKAQNNTSEFNEQQYILRLKSTGEFDVVLVPYDKGEKPSPLTLTGNSTSGYRVNFGVQTVELTD